MIRMTPKVLSLVVLGSAVMQSTFAAKYIVYTGTYTNPGGSKGIYSFQFDSATGAMGRPEMVAETPSPSFLAVHPNGKFLYAVNEHGTGRTPDGSVSAYEIDAKTGGLKKLNVISSGGATPCHLVVDKTGKMLAFANYGSGSVGSAAIKPDGSLDDKVSIAQHKGSSIDRERQTGPHAHATVISKDNKFLFVPELGLDQVMSYRLNPTNVAVTPNDPPFLKIKSGSGPRHFAFAPGGKYAFVNNEMASTVTALTYDPARGSFQEQQTISTLPKGFSGQSTTAESEVDAKGRFLYVSNRGHDSIAVFAIGTDGKLTEVEHASTQGKTPRNFKIDPTGQYLLAANQDSGSVVEFKIDAKTGKLTPTGKTLQIPAPVCLLFVKSK